MKHKRRYEIDHTTEFEKVHENNKQWPMSAGNNDAQLVEINEKEEIEDLHSLDQ